ncbi:MAG: hypothetical protein JRI23_00875 [Deltaproteobacteria bacterium]|jgi:Na+/H+ antiporter NhaD/arsenite permease-like protein|nr:hypothetical protein [Deltaproteobacteria bacterium]MBW2530006.1 hypothetical protein [Deltaproteobacteria bacterium]
MRLLMLAGGGSGSDHAVPLGVTLLFAALLVAMIVALALEEKLHAKKSLITGVFAIVTLFLGTALGLLPFEGDDAPIINAFGERLSLPVYIPAVDWEVITIILGSSLFVDVVSRSGLFTWIAIKLTRASRGDPWLLLAYYGAMTVVFSALLNNVTAMLIVGSLTAVSLGKLRRNHLLLGFLLVEGLLTNVGGLLTLISSVPNIIIGHAAGFSFIEFFIQSAPYVLVATVATIALGARAFRIRRLTNDEDRAEARAVVAGFDENDGIESRGFFWTATALFVLFILTLANASWLPVIRNLHMGYVALAFAVAILVRYKSTVDRFYQALDWDLLLFFASLFIVINVMEHAQVLGLLGKGLERLLALGDLGGSAALLASSAVASSVTDNIPLAAMLAKILGSLAQTTDGMWWSVVFGANLGGNITPIGSASTVVAVTIMHKHALGVSFARFVRLALPFAAVQIALAIGYVLLFVQ